MFLACSHGVAASPAEEANAELVEANGREESWTSIEHVADFDHHNSCS
jgi:hypothetical protein